MTCVENVLIYSQQGAYMGQAQPLQPGPNPGLPWSQSPARSRPSPRPGPAALVRRTFMGSGFRGSGLGACIDNTWAIGPSCKLFQNIWSAHVHNKNATNVWLRRKCHQEYPCVLGCRPWGFRVSAGTWRDEGINWIPKGAEKVSAWKCVSTRILIMKIRIDNNFP